MSPDIDWRAFANSRQEKHKAVLQFGLSIPTRTLKFRSFRHEENKK
jgi:hypothetical protein